MADISVSDEANRQRMTGSDASSSEKPARPFFAELDSAEIALEAGKIGIWSWDLATNRITWSSNLETIHGLPAGSFDGTFSFFENDIDPRDRPGVLATIKAALETREPYSVQYRLPPQAGREEQWIEALATVVIENGVPVRMVGICRNVSERVGLVRELSMHVRQQEAVAYLGERALARTSIHILFSDAAEKIADILQIEMVKILELAPGDAGLLLRAGVGWKPGHVGSAIVSIGSGSQSGYTLSVGGPVVVDDLKTETRFSGPSLLHEHDVVSGMTVPIAGRDGRAYGVLGAHTTKRRRFSAHDVSFLSSVAHVLAGAIQRHELDQRQELMIRELRHRSGNLFSQLLALFSQTAKGSRTLNELVPKYEARVLALANAHRLITEGGWKSTSLGELLRTLLAPYLDRVTFSGPEVMLDPDPTFALSMSLHELVTNATKHGSLSEAGGRIALSWAVKRTERGLTLVFDWTERGGPPPKRVRKPGFGSKLITTVIERQLNGEVRPTFSPQGLSLTLTIPLSIERWPQGDIQQPVPATPQ
jgi:two-component sensor histidine kinase